MNFTREPIIETIITPKEGCKLIVRSSKSEDQEEYIVDAVEVVSFGQALFFRSIERPKPFLVPVGDYEIVEGKETRTVLKNAQFERTIKIGGGREAAPKREQEEPSIEEEVVASEESIEPARAEAQFDNRRRDRRHRRRRRSHEEREEMRHRVEEEKKAPSEGEPASAPTPTPGFSTLIPPPTTLISETIGRYKEQQSASEPPKPEAETKEEKKSEGEPNPLNRVAVETHAPFFSPVSDWSNFLS